MTSVYAPNTTALGGGAASALNNNTAKNHQHCYNPAVSRSNELLSCAKTALKIARNRHAKEREAALQSNNNKPVDDNNQWFSHINPADLELHNPQHHQQQQQSPQQEILEDGLALLRTMEHALAHLETLVRRRGHTNDPTEEITVTVQRLEQDARELTGLITVMVAPTGGRGGQHQQLQRHWKAVQQWFQQAAQRHAARLKEILKVRGTVLQEQARRRQRFQPNPHHGSQQQSSAAANALFAALPPPPPVKQPKAAPPPPPPPQSAPAMNGSNGTATTSSNNNNSAPSSSSGARQAPNKPHSNLTSYYGTSSTSIPTGYGGTAYGGGSRSNAAYYGGSGHTATTGMRQRRARGDDQAATQQQQEQQQQAAMQQQLLERQTQHRMHEARQAEKSLAELTGVFGKMATLITQQSETLEKVEDDVEAAMADVTAGHGEITTLYSLKKGNRALILKVFGLLIFFIVFMRFYVRK